MNRRSVAALLCLGAVIGAAWIGASGPVTTPTGWTEVSPGVLRSAGLPAGYALVSGDAALLIDAPCDPAALAAKGIAKVEAVLLTHHHRDTCAAVGKLLDNGTKVRAGREAAEWLTPDNVKKYWQESLPLRGSRTAYLVVPEGYSGIDCSLADGQTIIWHDWTVRVVATPGHSRDHLAFAARRGAGRPLLVFCGDALVSRGKLWTPYTTDWDHWTDAGLTPAAKSLRRLAELQPAVLLPAHGPVIDRDAPAALQQTAKAVEEVAFLKSYERYTKQRLGNAPSYRFLAKEQAGSNGSLPWSRVSEHLFYTGNTWVLTSKDNSFLVMDPWGKLSAEQIAKLKDDRKLGKLEVVMFSHAHFDHYDGIYELPDRDRFEVWMLDKASLPVAEPFLLRAPFLDARPSPERRRQMDLARVPLPFLPPAGPDRVHDGRRDSDRWQALPVHGGQLVPSGSLQRHGRLDGSEPQRPVDLCRERPARAKSRPGMGAGRAWRGIRVQCGGLEAARRLGPGGSQGCRCHLPKRQAPPRLGPARRARRAARSEGQPR